MRSVALEMKLLATVGITSVLLSGCGSTDSGSGGAQVSGGVYYGVGFYDPWYYGPGYYPPAAIVAPPLDKPIAPHVENPIANPRPSTPVARPTPSIPSTPRPALRR